MSNSSNHSMISKNTADQIIKLITYAYSKPILSFSILQLIFMLWFYISFHYIDSDNKIKKINYKTIIIKYLYYVLPFHILFACNILLTKQIISYHQYIMVCGLIILLLQFSWFYVSMTNIDKNQDLNKLTLSQVFAKYIIYTSPIIFFVLLILFNYKYVSKLVLELAIKSKNV